MSETRALLANHHVAALVVVVPLLTALAVDWIITGVTGERTFITDDALSAPLWVHVLLTGGLCLACAMLIVVLRRERPLFLAVQRFGRTLRVCRTILMAGLVAMIAGNGIIYPLLKVFEIDSGPIYNASGLAAFFGLAATFLPAMVIGLTQVRRNELGVGGRVLALSVLAVLLTVAVFLFADDWASPVLLTMTVLGGISVVGVGARPRS
ncbi:MAG: hypothetical protein QM714_14185 [Nocardioides sp.]|uniref:hypothetical protein n=1 Tax=Nocardioides sp. TaxID=35761 RepID=UPI0039E4E08A